MKIAKSQKHPATARNYLISEFLNQLSRKGTKATIVLYLTSETFRFDPAEALEVYTIVAISLIFLPILGALLGDMIIGGQRSTIWGGTLQGIGTMSMAIPNPTLLYMGLALFIAGTSLYAYNLLANYSKAYNRKTLLWDSAFTIFLGAGLLAQLSYNLIQMESFSLTFLILGALSLLSVVPLLRRNTYESPVKTSKPHYLLLAYTFMALLLYNLFNNFFNAELENVLKNMHIPASEFTGLNIYIWLFLIVLLGIYRSYFSVRPFFSLSVGTAVTLLSFILILFAETLEPESRLLVFIVSLALSGLAWLYITPVSMAIICGNIPEKYRAFSLSLLTIPVQIAFYAYGYWLVTT